MVAWWLSSSTRSQTEVEGKPTEAAEGATFEKTNMFRKQNSTILLYVTGGYIYIYVEYIVYVYIIVDLYIA